MKVISSEEKFRCSLFTVSEDVAVARDGFQIKRAIVHHPGSAVMLAVDDRKRVLLVKQYRLPARQDMWEIPAGKVDIGETPLGAAKRELMEETGCRAKKWRKLASYYPSPGFLAEKMNIFLATGLTEGEATPMDDERIQARWFTITEVDKMLQENKIIDGKTFIAFLFWRKYVKS